MELIRHPKLKEIKKTMLNMVYKANVSHIGSALSVVDILYSLYFNTVNISKKNIQDLNRDIILLSKGHASVALYSILYHKGLIDKVLIDNYALDNGKLPCHIDKEKSPFFEASTGSLGHGASIAAGMALAKKISDYSGHVYVICSDGECNEGSLWEAVMFAATHHLNNLTVIVDCNGLQAFGATSLVINQDNLSERFTAFGFDSFNIDGHNFDAIRVALTKRGEKPIAVIAHTIKGKGVSFMENKIEWHYKSPNNEQLNIALQEIEAKY